MFLRRQTQKGTLWNRSLKAKPSNRNNFWLVLLAVAVSFTHVIESAEPVFSVVFSSFLGVTYPIKVWLSILPIVFGCSLAAVTEVSFNFQGLWGAIISNVRFVLRNIYSKRSLQNFKEIDGLNLYGWSSIISFLYPFPAAILVEGSQWIQGYHKAIATVGQSSTFYFWVILSGVFYHLYNQNPVRPLNALGSAIAILGTFLYSQATLKPKKIEAEKQS
ncbi:Sugar phosphate transporter domain [Dillenia turbinata]|uniref:Sugar phosphate transporter domain n=1 Tax=Dillenia turbinata TaxID=194707 RepID=A0AAN8UM64_9MAGN